MNLLIILTLIILMPFQALASQDALSHEDVVRVLRAENSYKEEMINEYNRVLSKKDLQNPQEAEAFNQIVRDKAQVSLRDFAGSEKAKLKLEASLQDYQKRFIAQMAKAVFEEQEAFVMRCDIEQKRWCKKTSCNSIKVKDEYVLIKNDEYSLCGGERDCQTFPIKSIDQSGIFFHIAFGGAAYMKLAGADEDVIYNINRGEFMEVRDNMLGVMTSWGTCKSEN